MVMNLCEEAHVVDEIKIDLFQNLKKILLKNCLFFKMLMVG